MEFDPLKDPTDTGPDLRLAVSVVLKMQRKKLNSQGIMRVLERILADDPRTSEGSLSDENEVV